MVTATPGPDRVFEVDGERFRVRLRARSGPLYDYDYVWSSGPNDSYGFSVSGPSAETDAEHTARIRDFLADIDPETGYLREE